MSLIKVAFGLFAAVVAAQTTTSAPSAGQTLSNGAYVCNPAHSYPGATCDGQAATPTLSYYPTSTTITTTTTPVAGQTLSNGAYVCNPAHSYPAGASCDGSGPTPTLVYASTTSAPAAGQTLSNGAYVCNPAHSYPGATCDGLVATPTLSYYPTSTGTTTSAPKAGETLSNGGYVCNPAHSYPGATCNGQAATPTLSYYPTSTAAVIKTSTFKTSIIPKSPSVVVTAAPTPRASDSGCSPVAKTVTITAFQAAGTSTTSASAHSKSCPLALTGTEYQYPHLIVVSTDGQKTSGTRYNATMSSKTTSFFNFDIPQAYAGKTCDVVFSLPRQDQLETSSFTLKGSGSLDFSSLAAAASQNANIPASSSKLGSWKPVPGYHYAVLSSPCAAGQTIGFSIAAEGTLALDYFQDYNPCAIGLYVLAH